jgi:hypothetical protein
MNDLVDKKNLVKSAKAFVKEKNKGLSSRLRIKLDQIKPALAILVNERMSVPNIQEFIHKHLGLKIGLSPVKRYLLENFNYPAPTQARTPASAKKLVTKARKSTTTTATKVSRKTVAKSATK